jgi:hypothetical protein
MTEVEFLALPVDQQIAKWREAERAARQWAAIELTFRKAMFAANFKVPVPGTNKVKLGIRDADGEELALVGDHKLNYSVDRPGWLAAIKAKLLPDELADKVVSWSAKVNGSTYRKLDDDDMKKVSPFITEKPGAPSLEIKVASSMRW